LRRIHAARYESHNDQEHTAGTPASGPWIPPQAFYLYVSRVQSPLLCSRLLWQQGRLVRKSSEYCIRRGKRVQVPTTDEHGRCIVAVSYGRHVPGGLTVPTITHKPPGWPLLRAFTAVFSDHAVRGKRSLASIVQCRNGAVVPALYRSITILISGMDHVTGGKRSQNSTHGSRGLSTARHPQSCRSLWISGSVGCGWRGSLRECWKRWLVEPGSVSARMSLPDFEPWLIRFAARRS